MQIYCGNFYTIKNMAAVRMFFLALDLMAVLLMNLWSQTYEIWYGDGTNTHLHVGHEMFGRQRSRSWRR